MTWATKTPADRAAAYVKLAQEIRARLDQLEEAEAGGRTERVNLGIAIRHLKGAASGILAEQAANEALWGDKANADADPVSALEAM